MKVEAASVGAGLKAMSAQYAAFTPYKRQKTKVVNVKQNKMFYLLLLCFVQDTALSSVHDLVLMEMDDFFSGRVDTGHFLFHGAGRLFVYIM